MCYRSAGGLPSQRRGRWAEPTEELRSCCSPPKALLSLCVGLCGPKPTSKPANPAEPSDPNLPEPTSDHTPQFGHIPRNGALAGWLQPTGL
ncbi:unnamed protein product [Arctogadus glacialis]